MRHLRAGAVQGNIDTEAAKVLLQARSRELRDWARPPDPDAPDQLAKAIADLFVADVRRVRDLAGLRSFDREFEEGDDLTTFCNTWSKVWPQMLVYFENEWRQPHMRGEPGSTCTGVLERRPAATWLCPRVFAAAPPLSRLHVRRGLRAIHVSARVQALRPCSR